MPRDVGFSLGAGLASVFLLLAYVTGVPGGLLFCYFAQAPIYLVGLALGGGYASIAAATGALAGVTIGGSSLALVYLGLFAAPVAFLAARAVRPVALAEGTGWRDGGELLLWLTGFASLWLVAMWLAFMGEEGGLEGWMRATIPQVFAQMAGDDAPPELMESFTAMASHLAAVIAMSWVVMTVLNGILSQHLAIRLGRNIRPTPRLSELQLPQWIAPVFAAALVLGLLPNEQLSFLGGNLVLVMLIPPFFLGLSVVHAAAGRTAHRTLLLVLFYVLLLILMQILIFAVSALGFLELWVRLRDRMSQSGPT